MIHVIEDTMNFGVLINSCYLFNLLMNFVDSWIFEVALDKIFNKYVD